MKKLLIFSFIIIFAFTLLAQNNQVPVSLEEQYDVITSEWLSRSGELKTYSGLAGVCTDAQYRKKTIEILSAIHHYDSLVLDALNDPANIMKIDHKEYVSSMKDIYKFEAEYGVRSFISLLRESCETRQDLEQNKEDLKKESGQYSYDGQILVLETEIRKYLKHLDKKVIRIDDHLHLLRLDDVMSYQLLGALER